MAVFTNTVDAMQRLDWRVLRDGGIALYWQLAVLQEDVAWLESQSYRVHRFDCTDWSSEDDFHREISSGLQFPAYYGHNLNAFNDSLGELQVPGEGGVALTFMKFDAFAKAHHHFAQSVLDIVAGQSRAFLLTGHRFLALLQSDDPRLEIEPVGGRHVQWNRQEWMNASRGL